MNVFIANDVDGLACSCLQGDVILEWLHIDVWCK